MSPEWIERTDSGALGLNVHPLVERVLSARGYDREQARAFLFPRAEDLHDPFLLAGMSAAVERIEAALALKERICVYGDYDLDGISATALCIKALRALGAECGWYIPDRVREGYGLNNAALDAIRASGATLVLTVDCGSVSFAEAEHARKIGLELIISDHHECRGEIPQACAVINPHRPGCDYPYKHLAGVGVAFKLICALYSRRNWGTEPLLRGGSGLCALGTLADVVPLTGENRLLAGFGLGQLALTRSPGLRALLRSTGLTKVNAAAVSYVLAPRINAAGRVASAADALNLLLCDDDASAEHYAALLEEYNRERRLREDLILQEAQAQCRERSGEQLLIVWGQGWHSGVAGIAASKLCEREHKPAAVICLADGAGRGSFRSIPGVNVTELLAHCSDCLTAYGGHEMAAGFSLLESRLPAFYKKALEYVSELPPPPPRALYIDARIGGDELTKDCAEALAALEPFGSGNPAPVFALYGAELLSAVPIGNGKHLRFSLRADGVSVNGVAFNTTGLPCRVGGRADFAVNMDINDFQGKQTLQLKLVDARESTGL